MPRAAVLSLSPLESREVPAAGLFADIRPGVWGSNPVMHGASGDTLYFSANNIYQGTELWATDGTPAGTRLVKDLNPGKPGSGIWGIAAGDGVMYFQQKGEGSPLIVDYKTDGTAAGTVPITHGVSSINAAGGIVGTGWKGELYYYSGTDTPGVWTLSKTDGTTVTRLTTFNDQPLDEGYSGVYPVFPTGPSLPDGGTDRLELTIRLKSGESQVWQTDGTVGGTVVRQSNLRATSVATGDVLLMAGTPVGGGKFAFPSDSSYGQEVSSLWAGDGTGTARTLLRTFDGVVSSAYGWQRNVSAGGQAVFAVYPTDWQAPPTADVGIWVTDGTAAGTVKLNLPADSHVRSSFDGKVVLGVPTADPSVWRVMVYDGRTVTPLPTPAGMKDLKWEFRGIIPADATFPKGAMMLQENATGKAYLTDGTTTALVDTAGLPLSPSSGTPNFYWHDVTASVGFARWDTGPGVYFKGGVYFPCRDPSIPIYGENYRYGTELWKWDLTATATTPTPAPAPAPKVLSTQVNDGSAQRSMVKTLTVKFDAAVTVDPAGVVIYNVAGNTTAFSQQLSTVNGKTTLTITFPNQPGGSIGDGRWTLRINAGAVKNQTGGTAMAANFSFAFTRVYGDTSGDGMYDRDTRTLVKQLLGQTVGSPGYRWDLDVNSDGKIDAADELAAVRNWGKGV